VKVKAVPSHSDVWQSFKRHATATGVEGGPIRFGFPAQENMLLNVI
jgi:hypothetical protein